MRRRGIKDLNKIHRMGSKKAHVTVLCLALLAGCFGMAYVIAAAFEDVGGSITIPGFDLPLR